MFSGTRNVANLLRTSLISRIIPQIRSSTRLLSTSIVQRQSKYGTFKIQFKLPGRTSGVLSAGVVPYPNDPMIPKGKYFKPKGLRMAGEIPYILSDKKSVYRLNASEFTLYASPWNPNEHPRDDNGLRFRDYRVSLVTTKKHYSKGAYNRWRATRLLRSAASLVLPDKGLKRCDYLFFAHPELQALPRDDVFLLVDNMITRMKHKILKDWRTNGRKLRPDLYSFGNIAARPRAKTKGNENADLQPGTIQKKQSILSDSSGSDKVVSYIGDIVPVFTSEPS